MHSVGTRVCTYMGALSAHTPLLIPGAHGFCIRHRLRTHSPQGWAGQGAHRTLSGPQYHTLGSLNHRKLFSYVPETGSLASRCGQGRAPLEEASCPWWPQASLARGIAPISASVVTWPPSRTPVSVSPLCRRMQS